MNKVTTFDAATSFKARFTTAEFIELADATDMRLELVDGELERMNPPNREHGVRQVSVAVALWNAVSSVGLVVVGEAGIDLGNDTLLGCDAAVVRGGGSGVLKPHELLLVIEIAETTLARDMGMKRMRYAAAAIPEYWVVDGGRSVVHVYREPIDGDYAMVHTVRFGEPLAVPGTDATIVIA